MLIVGEFKPRSSFLGNSICANLNGHTRIIFQKQLQAPYVISYPNLYARGIFLGDSLIEVVGKSIIKCEHFKQEAVINFKEKGYFVGERDQLGGEIVCSPKRKIGLTGKWSGAIKFEEEKVSIHLNL